jgi:transcriptional regulator with XRE-family HTH domain
VTGFQIAQLREALNMSRPELARALSITPNTLANWEKDSPHGLGSEVLHGLYLAVFDGGDEVRSAAWSARVEKLAIELRLGLGAMLFFRLMNYVERKAVP